MNNFTSELIGTAIMMLLGNGVVANVVLNKTKGNNSGWIVITMGWAMAVYVAVQCSGASGAHLNPAVTLGLVAANKFALAQAPMYILAQMLGAMLGSSLVWLMYRDHYNSTDDADGKMATFCNTPAIRNTASNLLSEIIGAFVLVYVILHFQSPEHGLGAVGALPVALLVLAIGLSLGGTTGYAINPARDLGPRIMHALLPISNKADSNWGYSWIPVVGPIIGAVLAGLLNSFVG